MLVGKIHHAPASSAPKTQNVEWQQPQISFLWQLSLVRFALSWCTLLAGASARQACHVQQRGEGSVVMKEVGFLGISAVLFLSLPDVQSSAQLKYWSSKHRSYHEACN